MRTSDPKAISKAKELLSRGCVIALPTDTIVSIITIILKFHSWLVTIFQYGLACVANNQEAIKKLYDIKGRHEEKPVAICVADYVDLVRWAEVSWEEYDF